MCLGVSLVRREASLVREDRSLRGAGAPPHLEGPGESAAPSQLLQGPPEFSRPLLRGTDGLLMLAGAAPLNVASNQFWVSLQTYPGNGPRFAELGVQGGAQEV